MPAKQWMTSGALRSQLRAKSSSVAHMILAGRRHVRLLVDDVVHRQDEMVCRGAGWPARSTGVPALSSVTQAAAPLEATVSSILDSGQT